MSWEETQTIKKNKSYCFGRCVFQFEPCALTTMSSIVNEKLKQLKLYPIVTNGMNQSHRLMVNC